MSNKLQNVLDEIKLEKDTNLLPENIKKDVKIFDIVGTLEGASTDVPVKLFETQEEMQADETAEEGDLAVVYRSEIQNATVDSKFQTATFPDTVILDSAITDYVYIRYRAVDDSAMFECMGQLDSSMFTMDCYTETGSIRIEYTSSDGITYTRTDTTGNPVDFGTEIYYERTEMWNDAIGKFIQVGGNIFDGLFECVPYTDDTKYLVYNFQDKNVQNAVVTGEISKQDITTVMNLVKANNISSVTSSGSVTIAKKTDNIIEVYYTASSTSAFYQYKVMLDGVLHIGFTNSRASTLPLYKYVVDLTTNTITSSTEISTAYSMTLNSASGSTTNVCVYPSVLDIIGFTTVDFNDFSIYSSSVSGFEANTETNIVMNYGSDVKTTYGVSKHYDYANSQLSAIAANELLPGRIAYGKNGVVTGDGSIWSSIPSSIILKDILKLNDFYNNGGTSLFKNIFETVGNIENNKEVTYLKRDSSGEYLVLTVNDVITSKTYSNYYNGTPIMKLNDGLRCTDYYPYGFIIRNIDGTEPLFTCSTRSKILKLKDNYLYYISLVDNAYKLLKLNTDNYEITEINTLLANANADVYISFNGDYKYAFISICGGQSNFPGRRAILFNFDTEELVDVLNASYKCYSFAIRYKDKIYFEYKLGSSSNSNIDLLSINLSNGSITKLLTNATSASFANVTDYTDLELNEAIGEDENYVYLNLYERLNKTTGIITRDMTPVINDLDLSASNLSLKKYVNETYYATGSSNTYLCLCNIQINDTTVTITGKKYYLGNQAYISIENELIDISILDKTIIGDICKLQSNEGVYLDCTGYTYSLSSSIDYDLAVVNGSTDTGFINQVIISDNTLSQTEYDTALDTTKQILGEEV